MKHPPFEYYDKCPICQCKGISDAFKVQGFIISRCGDCSVRFVREILTGEFLKTHYQKQVEGNYVYDSENEKCRDYYYKKIKSEIKRIRPGTGRILDVGCSSGGFLHKMRGWKTYGIEISKEFGDIAKKRVGNRVFIGSFEEFPGENQSFDVITFQDVFDHFINPVENLKKCFAMLKPGGVVIIKVHNISCLYAQLSGANFNAIIPPDHLFYFNLKSLKHLLEKIGFRFLEAKYIGHILQLKTVFFRLSRGDTDTFFYRIFKLFEKTALGKIRVYKNLHDIITVFASKSGQERA